MFILGIQQSDCNTPSPIGSFALELEYLQKFAWNLDVWMGPHIFGPPGPTKEPSELGFSLVDCKYDSLSIEKHLKALQALFVEKVARGRFCFVLETKI